MGLLGVIFWLKRVFFTADLNANPKQVRDLRVLCLVLFLAIIALKTAIYIDQVSEKNERKRAEKTIATHLDDPELWKSERKRGRGDVVRNKQWKKPVVISRKRWIFFSVGEHSFNRRREHYLRLAQFVRSLSNNTWDNVLVVPAFQDTAENEVHWETTKLFQRNLYWKQFFELGNMSLYTPMSDFEDYLSASNFNVEIDRFTYVTHDVNKCPKYVREISTRFYTDIFGDYTQLVVANVECVIVDNLQDIRKMLNDDRTNRYFYLDNSEFIVDMYEAKTDLTEEEVADFWNVRKSLRFLSELTDIADNFRRKTFERGVKPTQPPLYMSTNWTDHVVSQPSVGSPYLCVHMRRGNLLKQADKAVNIPSIEGAAEQINELLDKLKLQYVYVSGQFKKGEFKKLKQLINGKARRYVPDEDTLWDILDPGVAVVEQWLCVCSRYFIGTRGSRHTKVIQDERSIFGFPKHTTTNTFTPDDPAKKAKERTSQYGSRSDDL